MLVLRLRPFHGQTAQRIWFSLVVLWSLVVGLKVDEEPDSGPADGDEEGRESFLQKVRVGDGIPATNCDTHVVSGFCQMTAAP